MNTKQLIKLAGLTMAFGAVLGYAVYNVKRMTAARMVINEEEIIELQPEERAAK